MSGFGDWLIALQFDARLKSPERESTPSVLSSILLRKAALAP
jgi:hypothetical protein